MNGETVATRAELAARNITLAGGGTSGRGSHNKAELAEEKTVYPS